MLHFKLHTFIFICFRPTYGSGCSKLVSPFSFWLRPAASCQVPLTMCSQIGIIFDVAGSRMKYLSCPKCSGNKKWHFNWARAPSIATFFTYPPKLAELIFAFAPLIQVAHKINKSPPNRAEFISFFIATCWHCACVLCAIFMPIFVRAALTAKALNLRPFLSTSGSRSFHAAPD